MQAIKSYGTILLVITFAGVLSLTSVFSVPPIDFTIASSGTISYLSPLHIEGRYIKDSLGNTVYLRGAGKIHWNDDPTGWWIPENGAWFEGYLTWSEDAVRHNFQKMKEWGLNSIRYHTVADWWNQDIVTVKTYTGSYRSNLKRSIEIAGEEGIYVIFDLYFPVNYFDASGDAAIPFAPYSDPATHHVMETKQDFADWWGAVANELKVYDNVIFELYNEPHLWDLSGDTSNAAQARNDWFEAMQMAITAIRNTGAQQLILCTWGLGCVPYTSWEHAFAPSMDWIEHWNPNDPLGNIFYTGHMYRTYYNPRWYDAYNYSDCYAKMQDCKFQYAVDELNVPVIIGEIGVNMWESDSDPDANGLTSLDKELLWAANVFNISNQWGISYNAWNWIAKGGDQWYLVEDKAENPSRWGQVLIDAVEAGGTTFPP